MAASDETASATTAAAAAVKVRIANSFIFLHAALQRPLRPASLRYAEHFPREAGAENQTRNGYLPVACTNIAKHTSFHNCCNPLRQPIEVLSSFRGCYSAYIADNVNSPEAGRRLTPTASCTRRQQ